jgi:hypothetical protein
MLSSCHLTRTRLNRQESSSLRALKVSTFPFNARHEVLNHRRACEDEAVMSNEKTPVATLPRLGELFVEAGVLSPKVVSECLLKAQHKQVPVGEVFINSGHVSAPDLQTALQTQELVRSGEVSKQSAARLVRRAYSAKITVKEAQAQEWCDRAFAMPFSNIGKLLCAAESKIAESSSQCDELLDSYA